MIQTQQHLFCSSTRPEHVGSKFCMEQIWSVCRFELPAFDMYCRLKLWSGIRCHQLAATS